MKIERMGLEEGACNFCDRGKIDKEGKKIKYPYTLMR